MSSPRYRRAPDVRIRPVPEMQVCLAYSRSEAELFTLNPLAWFVLDGCSQCTAEEIAAEYYAAMEPLMTLEEAQSKVHAALASLLGMRLVQAVESPKVPPKTRTRRKRHAKES